MPKLAGDDAFDKILDALIQAVKSNAGAAGKIEIMYRDQQVVHDRAATAIQESKKLKGMMDAAEPKLIELYAAALDLSAKLTQALGDAGMTMPILEPQRKRLNYALEAAREYCGIIPF